ncbi:hypothetical protein AAFF_G00114000 [Aldrovandia affinis]|uniref:Uncharacterized protein n=1 Tax=Aldrovandia affinis TaxID=143900 RepID=A0AAD7RSQ3_9TELE|nr:hypothetical protein AAFF_G00114000 [Aldrovandia affinis]
MKFIQRTETIILVVVPCNVDIATTEVLRMAQDVDPEGKRTLAILTKPDLVDRGTERGILEIMKNTVIPLSKGYLIVKCRGQKDINDRISLSEATRRERDFFKNHEYFSVFLKQEKATIQCLASKLTHNLVNHIKSSLPLISEQVRKQLWDTRKELSECEKGPPLDPYQRKSFLITTLTDFNRKIEDLSSGETTSGENMYYEMRAEFAKWKDTLDGANERFHNEMQKVVKEYEHRHRGRELPGFTNYKVFEEVAQEIVAELKGPAICTMKTIKDIVLKTYTDTADRCFSRYPYLLHVSKDKIENIHSKQEAKVEERIEEQIKMEQLVYTQDALYKKSLKETYDSPIDYSKQTNKDRPSVDSEDGTDAVDDRDMVDRSNCPEKMVSYYKIVAQRMADQVPMLISLFMLKEAAQLLCGEMLNLMDGADVREILREDSDISRRRIDMQGRQERLSLAQEKLNNFQ